MDCCWLCNIVCVYFFFSSRRRHTICALVTGVQTCALPIYGTGQRFAVNDSFAATNGGTRGGFPPGSGRRRRAHLVGIKPLQRGELGRVPAQDISVARITAHEVLMARLGAIEAFLGLDRHVDRLGERSDERRVGKEGVST